MKTKFLFTAIIMIIIALLRYYGLDQIILISILFTLGISFSTWIFIDCDPDEEDSGIQKAYWVFSSLGLFVLCCILYKETGNESLKDAVGYATILPGINSIFSLSTTL